MRGTQAKRLRRIIAGLSVGQPWAEYIKPKENSKIISDGLDKYGKPMTRHWSYTGTMKLVPSCARYKYKELKRLFHGVGLPSDQEVVYGKY